MDDVTALRDALLEDIRVAARHGERIAFEEASSRLDALIVAVEARAAITPERLARALHATAPRNHPPAPLLRSICTSHEPHLDQARQVVDVLAALPRPEEPRVERCADCGRPEDDWMHREHGSAGFHPFTPEAR